MRYNRRYLVLLGLIIYTLLINKNIYRVIIEIILLFIIIINYYCCDFFLYIYSREADDFHEIIWVFVHLNGKNEMRSLLK